MITSRNYLCGIINYGTFNGTKQQPLYYAYGFYGSIVWEDHSGTTLFHDIWGFHKENQQLGLK